MDCDRWPAVTEPRFLVTGAHGCIGAWVVHELVADGLPVITMDLSTEPVRCRLLLGAGADEVAHVTGDITDPASIGRAAGCRRNLPLRPADPRNARAGSPCSRRGSPARPRSTRKCHDRPVTPRSRGSSPVAPVSICRGFCASERPDLLSHPVLVPRQSGRDTTMRSNTAAASPSSPSRGGRSQR
jgi:NAD dependent epimerase/dehydratase family